MRIKITLLSYESGVVDFNYQHQIQTLIYSFLEKSNPDYSKWLHKEGFVYQKDKKFKFFVFSGIIFHGKIKTNRSNGLDGFIFHASTLNPFTLSFQIASPVNQFIQHLVDGIFKEGAEVRLGRQRLTIQCVETVETLTTDRRQNICGSESNSFSSDSCLLSPELLLLKPLESPIFVKKPMPEGERDQYLFPGNEGFEEFLNKNLVHKYETLYGRPYKGQPLVFKFKPSGDQLKIVKSFKVYKNGKITDEIKGTLLPFTVSGSEELIKIGIECGFGQNNSMGCGYVET